MVDFNTKKNILQKLRKKRSENKLMWLPCVIAAAFVKLWYGTVCRMGMALSDRNGNFLGIKMPERKPKSRRQDEIVYIKKPFIGRVLSAVLAAAFVLMVAPELSIDLGVTARAADSSSSITVDGIDGKIYHLVPKLESAGNEGDAYLYDEAVHAEQCVTVKNIQYTTANGALKLNWEYDVISSCNHKDMDGKTLNSYSTNVILDHYQVIIKKASGAEVVSKNNGKDTELIISGLPKDDGDYTVEIIPVSTMAVWHFQLSPTSTDDDKKYIVAPTSVRDPIELGQIKRQSATVTGLKFNASLKMPNLNIMYKDVDGSYKNFDNEPYSYDSTVYLQWDKVKQAGGNAPDTDKDATGYRVHISTDSGNSWSATEYPVGNGSKLTESGDNYMLPVNVSAGLYYQFYVEAYKVNWGNTSYSTSNPGMITSGSQPVGNAKDLYTAPQTPAIEAAQAVSTTGKKFYEITIKRGGVTGQSSQNYDGILLFRTESQELKSDAADGTGFNTFAEWALDKISGDTSALHNLKLIHEFTKNETTYSDIDIVEGKTYYYYAVAYKNIDTSTSVIKDKLYAKGYSRAFTTFSLESFKKIKPPVPNLSITDDQVTITWDPISGAEAYEIEITQTGTHDGENKTVPIAADKQVSVIYNSNTTTYIHKGLNYSDSYRYCIRGIVNMDTEQTLPDGTTQKVNPVTTQWSFPAEATVGTRIDTPIITNVTTTDGQATITWQAVSGAKGYDLYYESDDPSNKSGTLKGITGTSYTHRNINNGYRYTYRVAAYKEIPIPGRPQESQKVLGNLSEPYSIKIGTEIATPQDLKLTTKDGEITATWTAVPGATGYVLYSTKDGSGVTDEFKVTKPTFTQTGLTNGDVYTYRVMAFKTVNGKDDESGLSTPASIKVGEELGTPQDLKATTVDGAITISWTAVKGAKGYTLMYRKLGSGTFNTIDVSKSPFTHTGLNNGDVYEYKVVAYKEVNGKIVNGPESVTIKQMVGSVLDAPKDFTVTTKDGQVDMKWTAVKGAEGYIIHASSGGRYYQFDVSKLTYTHSDLSNGDIWTYYVTAYKTVNGSRTYSNPSESKTVTIGISLNSAVDLTATAGNRQIDLTWTAVKGAEGYVVYLYNSSTMEFEPITVTSKTSYSHVGLKNGKQYTYMVAPYKNINGKRFYGDYSMSVTAIPTTGSITDMDHELIVKGTAPYGISHSEYITAVSNHGAFDESVDVYFSTNRESTQAVRDVLKNYANGLSSFIIYPFDISIYRENTYIEVDPEDGYTVTITMPVPDRLIAYRDYITVVHIGDIPDDTEQITLAEDWYSGYDRQLEVLPCAIVDIDNVWCVQFKCSSFSPYAFVIYKEHIQDVASGGGLMDTGFSDTFNSGVLLFTALPDILPNNRKLRIVQSGSKRYHIKSVTKR